MISDYSIIICGCTINSSSYIERHLQHLQELKPLFKDFSIVIYENDSVDNTTEILKDLERNGTIQLITEKGITNRLKKRTTIIAHGRNTLIDHVIKCNKYDYMIMVDLDDILKQPIGDSIKRAFEYNTNEWDVLTGNCSGLYYDIWALRINKKQWSETHQAIWDTCLDYDVWDMIKHVNYANMIKELEEREKNFAYYTTTTQKILQRKILRETYVKSFQKNIPSTSPLIPVESAFGGIGIYKISAIKDCKYNGLQTNCTCSDYDVKGDCIDIACEHISFHKDIIQKNDGKIFICPTLLVANQEEHMQ